MKTTYFLLTLVFASTTAFAQLDSGENAAPPGPYHHPTPLLPSDFGFSQHHPSTVAEGYLRGLAAWLHALGNYLVNKNQAAVLAEQVRWLDQSNDQRLIEFHDWKQQQRAKHLDSKRKKNEAERPKKYRVAYELSSDQLDSLRGEISWPKVLRALRYDELRRRLDVLFREQAGYVGLPQTDYRSQIERESQSLIRRFGQNRREVPRTEYLAAQKFLRGLKYEPLFRSQVL